MPSRAVCAVAAGVSASFGFAFAHFAPRPPAPPRIVTRVVHEAAPPVPSAPPTPGCSSVRTPTAPVATPLAPLVRTPATAPPEPRTPASSGSPLAAFRFAGLGPAGGLRLSRVRAGTLPDALGLRSGDELVSINDYKLADPEQALTAYARLRGAERLRLAVIRGGARTELVYFIR